MASSISDVELMDFGDGTAVFYYGRAFGRRMWKNDLRDIAILANLFGTPVHQLKDFELIAIEQQLDKCPVNVCRDCDGVVRLIHAGRCGACWECRLTHRS